MSDPSEVYMDEEENNESSVVIQYWMNLCSLILHYLDFQITVLHNVAFHFTPTTSSLNLVSLRWQHMFELVYKSDVVCIEQLRMDRMTFQTLCNMLKYDAGLEATPELDIDEQVAMFLHILAHHVKNRVIGFNFHRSGETISRYFRRVLRAILKLHPVLLHKPQPVMEGCNDHRLKYFKDCLGALDGTYIKVTVPASDRARYRTRKGDIAQNVLAACSFDEKFIYVLAGWEGSAADSRVIRDALSRHSGLKVPRGYYYLVDAGFANAPGFLAPYRGERYHLQEWRDGRTPVTAREIFNYRHASARNVIERCFGQLKARWAILRSPCFYPLPIQTHIILACCLLHNLIKLSSSNDSSTDSSATEPSTMHATDTIVTVESSDAWTAFRDQLAHAMFVDAQHIDASI